MRLAGVVLFSFAYIAGAIDNRVFFLSSEGLATAPLDDGSFPEVVASIPGGCDNARGIAVDHNWKIALVSCGVSIYKVNYENTPATVETVSLQGGEGTAKHSITMTNRGVSYITQYSATDQEWQVLAYDFLGCARHARSDTCLDGCKFENNRCKDDNVYGFTKSSSDSKSGTVTYDDGIVFLAQGEDIVFPQDRTDTSSSKVEIPVVTAKKFSLSGMHMGSSGNVIFSTAGNEVWRTSTGLTRVLKVGSYSPTSESGAANFWYFNDANVLVAAEGRNIMKYDCTSEPCFDVSEVFVSRTSPVTVLTAWFSREKEVIPEEEFLPTEKPEPVETPIPTTDAPETPTPAVAATPTPPKTDNNTTEPSSSEDGVDVGVTIIIAVVVSVVVFCLAAGCFFAYRSRKKKEDSLDIERRIQNELQRHPAIIEENAAATKKGGNELHCNPLLSLPECGDVHHDNNSSDDALSIITAINTVNTANITSVNSRTPRTPHTPSHGSHGIVWPSSPTHATNSHPTAPPRRRGTAVRGSTPEHVYPHHHSNYQTRRSRAYTRTLPPSSYPRQTV